MWMNDERVGLCFAGIGGALGVVLGGFDGFLYALVLFCVVDYATGIVVAIEKKTLSSEIGFRGIAKKCMIFILVAIANVVDTKVIGTAAVLRTAVIFFYLSNEGISILENAGAMGLPIPKKLREVLLQLEDEGESHD